MYDRLLNLLALNLTPVPRPWPLLPRRGHGRRNQGHYREYGDGRQPEQGPPEHGANHPHYPEASSSDQQPHQDENVGLSVLANGKLARPEVTSGKQNEQDYCGGKYR